MLEVETIPIKELRTGERFLWLEDEDRQWHIFAAATRQEVFSFLNDRLSRITYQPDDKVARLLRCSDCRDLSSATISEQVRAATRTHGTVRVLGLSEGGQIIYTAADRRPQRRMAEVT